MERVTAPIMRASGMRVRITSFEGEVEGPLEGLFLKVCPALLGSDRKPGLRAISEIGRVEAGGIRPLAGWGEIEVSSVAECASGKVNSKRPSLLVKAAKWLLSEVTRARAIGSWVTLLRTMPRMVLLLSDADCAEEM